MPTTRLSVSGSTILALALVPGVLAPAAAQTPRARFETFGTLGVGSGEFTSEALGGGRAYGLSAAGGIGMRPVSDAGLASALGFELEVNAVRTERYSAQPELVVESRTDTYLTASALLQGGNDRVEAFGLLGAGKRFVSGRRDDMILQYGAGARVFLSPSVSFRSEVRVIPEWGPTTWRVSTGLGYYW